MTSDGEGGRCYAAALEIMVALHSQGEEPILCHGLPVGTGPQNGGQRFGHAWVEVKTGRGWIVFDYSHADTDVPNSGVHMKRASYYRIGKIEHDDVTRYTFEEAMDTALEADHSGPWEERFMRCL